MDIARELLRAIESAIKKYDDDDRIFTSEESRSWTKAQRSGSRYAFATTAVNLGLRESHSIAEALQRLSPTTTKTN